MFGELLFPEAVSHRDFLRPQKWVRAPKAGASANVAGKSSAVFMLEGCQYVEVFNLLRRTSELLVLLARDSTVSLFCPLRSLRGCLYGKFPAHWKPRRLSRSASFDHAWPTETVCVTTCVTHGR